MLTENWPELKPKTDFTIPKEASFEIKVAPCGEDAWEPILLIWPEVIEKETRALYLHFEYCLDLEVMGNLDVSRLGGIATLTSDVAFALAALFEKAELTIDFAEDSHDDVVFRLMRPGYEAVACCKWKTFMKAIRGTGLTAKELRKHEIIEQYAGELRDSRRKEEG